MRRIHLCGLTWCSSVVLVDVYCKGDAVAHERRGGGCVLRMRVVRSRRSLAVQSKVVNRGGDRVSFVSAK